MYRNYPQKSNQFDSNQLLGMAERFRRDRLSAGRGRQDYFMKKFRDSFVYRARGPKYTPSTIVRTVRGINSEKFRTPREIALSPGSGISRNMTLTTLA